MSLGAGGPAAIAALLVALSAGGAGADRGATCTLTVVHARDGEAAASIDPALAPLSSLLSVPPFTIYKVFRRLAETALSFSSIAQEHPIAFSSPELAGLSGRIAYTGFSASGGDLLFEVKLSKEGRALLEPVTIRLSGAPVPLVVPWPDPMNVLILVFRCQAAPAS